jgi:hypothetical protein
MKKILLIGFLYLLPGCKNEDIFSPDIKYIFAPEWKIWEIKYINPNASVKHDLLLTRDIDTRYIFTDSAVYRSGDRGQNFIKYHTLNISLESISFSGLDSASNIETYFVRDLFVTDDAFPPQDSIRKIRDSRFPEIRGKLLFMRLENKQKVTIENQERTESLLLYN